MTNLILCGGSGTRLWPLSRTLMPKQFIKLFENQSLFQLTVKRNHLLCEKQYIVSNSEQYFLALDQLEEMQFTKNSFLLEPVGRNTAPAIALVCFDMSTEEIVLVSPSDHLIKNQEAYHKVIKHAEKLASSGYLVTFGITPTYAETGYGYIEADDENVRAFHEKPSESTAQRYVDAGNYYWNSGIFCFKAGIFLEELKTYSPDIYKTSKIAYTKSKSIVKQQISNDEHMIRITHEDMINIPANSIDYAVMEKSKKVKVVASDINWSDMGSFDALYDELEGDIHGNKSLSTPNPQIENISNNAYNNLIISEKLVTTIDVEDLIIVDTADALLISKKGSGQKIKDVVNVLKERDSELVNIHQTAHRPWGTYTILEDTPGYKIKRIEVKPGKRLSLQKHFHRNEHWIVVSGTATVTVENTVKLVRPNESTYIKMGEIHRLENNGKIPIVLIEAQVGEYTGEDDIVRIEDDFQRIN